ncbi:hypothetical protein E2C01_032320 [Portunus trituberculatus]|uniref:Uncharacterized protein n=1 Tax=Portunus trituberculatus TaxID=210409 RepID=A0A5B7F2H1_PORTR|nr:hypothetical protein [Portunus trituberculatus]
MAARIPLSLVLRFRTTAEFTGHPSNNRSTYDMMEMYGIMCTGFTVSLLHCQLLCVSVHLSVYSSHAPLWVTKPPTRINVTEGSDLLVKAVALANPGPVRYCLNTCLFAPVSTHHCPTALR